MASSSLDHGGWHDGVAGCRRLKSRPKSRRPNYRRRVKPPLSYAELIAVAIKESPNNMLTLRSIQNHMSTKYECFRGSYNGWKNSVRHNLSASDCFVKVLKDKERPHAKDNFWALNPDCSHCKLCMSCPLRQEGKTRSPLASVTRKTSSTTVPHGSSSSSATPSVTTSDVNQDKRVEVPSTRLPPPPTMNNDVRPHIESPVSDNWPSPQPSFTPAHPTPDSHQPNDEWDLLSDLYVPDSDIDMSLYNDETWTYPDSHHNNSHRSPAGQLYRGIQPVHGQDFIQRKTHSRGESGEKSGVSSSNSAIFLPGRIKSEYVTANRYHPYGNQMSGNSRRHEQYAVSRNERYTSKPRRTNDSRHVPSSFGNDSMMVSAIRSSLGLDLDEMALYAIEDSVRVLDLIRPCDLMCA